MGISTPSIANSRRTTTATNLNRVGTIAGGIVPVDGTSTTAPSATGTALATLKVEETGVGAVRQTILTFTALPQTLPAATGTEFIGSLLYTMPVGRIAVLGATGNFQQTTTSDLTTTLNASKTGQVGVGTATASNVTLSSTMQNIIPVTAFTSSATVNVAGTAVSAALAAMAQFDGTSSAVGIYLNTAFVTDADTDAAATIAWSGTIVITWINLGDY